MIGEKGADLIKELWLQEGLVRAERSAKAAHVAEVVKKVTESESVKNSAYTYANATAA